MAKLTNEKKLEIILSEEFQTNFWLKFNRSVGEEKCWLWTGKTRNNEKIYISTYIKGEENRDQAHRVSLTMKLGYFPKADAAHREEICKDNKYRCANPEHLYDGSKSENRHDENIAGKTKPQKDARKARFHEIIKESSKAERKYFYDILHEEFFT